MALTDILRDRAARRGGTAQVDCGELGLLTVEALSPADCARLSGDSRALLYAACRELQRTGEALRGEGGLFRPDEVMAYVTDEEAAAAARTILELSGLSEVRHESVQSVSEAVPEIRPLSVQSKGTQGGLSAAEDEIRPRSVQTSGEPILENGQVSREFYGGGANFSPEDRADRKAQIIGEMSGRTAQILVAENGKAHQSLFPKDGAEMDLHETESEFRKQDKGHLHEIKSEFRKSGLGNLHEITSDFGSREGRPLHETESESAWLMHEIKSELQRGLHEIKSEVREMLHEIESELPEQAAQRLAEGILQAVGVR